MYAAIAAALLCWQNLMQTEPSNMQVNRFFINTIMSIAHCLTELNQRFFSVYLMTLVLVTKCLDVFFKRTVN